MEDEEIRMKKRCRVLLDVGRSWYIMNGNVNGDISNGYLIKRWDYF